MASAPAPLAVDRFGGDPTAFANFVGAPTPSDVSAQLERWEQLHRAVPAIPMGEARLKMTWAMSDPVWPAFKAMGFKRADAFVVWSGLRSDDLFRRTSAGVNTGVGTTVSTVSTLTGALKTAPSEANLRQLESQLTRYISDNPADLIEHPEVQAALEAVVLTHATLLQQVDADTLQSYFFDEHRFGTLSPFTALRELSILDPMRARGVGREYVAALRDAQARLKSSRGS